MFDPPVRHEGHNGWPGSGDRWCLPDPHSSGRSFSNWWAARACPPAGASTPVAPPPPPRGSVPGVGRARHRAAHGRRPTPSGRRRSSDVRGESSAPPRGGGRGGGEGAPAVARLEPPVRARRRPSAVCPPQPGRTCGPLPPRRHAADGCLRGVPTEQSLTASPTALR